MQRKKRWQRSRPNRSRYVSAPYVISQKPARLCPEQRQRLICWRRGYSRRATSTAWRDANARGSAGRSDCQTSCARSGLAIQNNGSCPCKPGARRRPDRFCIPHTCGCRRWHRFGRHIASRRFHQPRCACGNATAPWTIWNWSIRPWTIRAWSDSNRAVWCDNAAASRANWAWANWARTVRPGANNTGSVGVGPAPAHCKPRTCCGRPWSHAARASRTRNQRHAPTAHPCCGFSLAHANGRQRPRSIALPQGSADI